MPFATNSQKKRLVFLAKTAEREEKEIEKKMSESDNELPWPDWQVAEYRRLRKECEDCTTTSGFILGVSGAMVVSMAVPWFRYGPAFRKYTMLIAGALVGQGVDLLHTSQACHPQFTALDEYAATMEPKPPRTFK